MAFGYSATARAAGPSGIIRVAEMNGSRGTNLTLAEEDLVDPRSIWRGLRRRLGLFIATFTAVFGVIAAYAFLSEPLYVAETTLVFEPKQSVVDIQDLRFPGGTNAQELDTQVELLRSPAMAIRVARRVGERFWADETAPVNSGRKAEDAISSAIDKTAEALEGANGVVPASSAPIKAEADKTVPLEVIRRMQNNLVVERVGATYMLRARYTSPLAANSAAIANAYAEEYVSQQLEARVDALRHANRWIDARLTVLREEVRNSEEAAARYRVANRLIDSPGGDTVVQQRITETVSALTEQRALLSSNNARYESVRRLRDSNIPLESIPEVMQSPTIRDLRNREAEISQRQAELGVRYGARHPELKKVEKEAADLQIQIDNEIARIVNSLRSEVAVTENRIRLLEEALSSLQEEAAEINPAQVRLQELERDTEASRGRYEALLNRQKELHEREGLVEADARIISRAEAPDEPSKPRRKLLVAGGLLLGIILAGAAAFVAEMSDPRVRNTSDIRREFGPSVPVVLVPQMKSQGWFRRKGVETAVKRDIVQNPRSPFSESMRDLHVALMEDVGENAKPVTVAFTSAQEGEGAFAVALGFAVQLAQAEHRVLFVDCCNESGADVFSDVDTAEEQGLLQIIGPKPTARESGDFKAVADRARRLFGGKSRRDMASSHLSTGYLAASRTGLSSAFAQRGFDDFLSKFRTQYDFVVFNAQPVLATADSGLICGRCDATFFVAEWLSSTRDAVRVGTKRLIDAHAELAGYVIANVDDRKRYYFGPEDLSFFFRRRVHRSVGADRSSLRA